MSDTTVTSKPYIQKNQPLAPYTYMKTGGPADELCIADTTGALIAAVTYARKKQLRYMIIGGGSNTLFADEGYRGLIIINRTNQIDIDKENHTITASSGVPTNTLVNAANLAGLAGLSWFLGVPGSVGGAVYNNSHYQDHFIGDNLDKVEILDETNQTVTLAKSLLEFAYDYSRFHHTKEIIVSATWQLEPGDPEILKALAKEALTKRKESQPLALPSSGCFFQNPDEATKHKLQQAGLPTHAGALIDQAGLKDKRIGDAAVSAVHANFIVNMGKATSADIQELSKLVSDTIYQKYQVKLQPEVFFINQYGERMD